MFVSHQSSQRRIQRILTPCLEPMEERTLLSTGAGTIAAAEVEGGADAYVTQLYYEVVGRPPEPDELETGIGFVNSGPAATSTFVRDLQDSDEVVTAEVEGLYQDLLDRDPDGFGAPIFSEILRTPQGFETALASILASDEYFLTQGGGTNEGFLQSVYSDVLGRLIDGVGQGDFLEALENGVGRFEVASIIVGSVEASEDLIDETYADLLLRAPDAVGQPAFLESLQNGLGRFEFEAIVLTSPEFVTTNQAVIEDITELASGDPNLTTLVAALEATDLIETLQGAGPFTVFAPTDEAFAALGEETLDFLLDNPEELAEILLYHVVPGAFSAPEVVGSGTFPTAEGSEIGIRSTGEGVTINDSGLVATNLKAVNGIVHVIDEVLMIPSMDIVETAVAAGSFTTLATALEATDLVETLQGEGPFTVFAPTDEAFAALGQETLDALLDDPEQLAEILLYHVVPNMSLNTTELTVNGRVETAQGEEVMVVATSDGLVINGSNVVVENIVTTNGMIQVIDQVLIPPTMA